MRLVLLACSLFLAADVSSQTLTLKAPAIQHVEVIGTTSAATVRPGGAVVLWADVTPKANIHVYAPGSKGFAPVALVMTPRHGAMFSKPSYPTAERSATLGITDLVPVYKKPFRILQRVVFARSLSSGETVTVAGAVNYQACDDRVCYAPSSIPVMWSVRLQ